MWFFKIFTRNRVFKHKGVVSNLHVCYNGLGKMWASYIFHFLQRILNSTHMKKFNIFLHNICRDVQHSFQVSIISKWLAKHISTKVSFKITIRKSHVYFDIRWPSKWNQYFYWGFRENERSKIIFLPSFQLVTRLNSQNRMKPVY